MKNTAKIDITLESGHVVAGEISLTDFRMEVDRYGVTSPTLEGYLTVAPSKPPAASTPPAPPPSS